MPGFLGDGMIELDVMPYAWLCWSRIAPRGSW